MKSASSRGGYGKESPMLDRKILSKTAKVAIIGLGHVGLPLAIEFCKAGFKTVGIDTDGRRVESIRNHSSYLLDVTADDLNNAKLSSTTDCDNLRDVDISIICVPTPLLETKEPDMSYIIAATQKIGEYLHSGQLVVLESTSYPGTTRGIVLPILETSGLRVGKDFYLISSPERIDPGNKRYVIQNIPKLVGGITADCTRIGKLLYGQLCDEVIVVSSPEIVETAKVFENSFRNVNIALANELAMLCDRMNMDVKEVIDAAATKPYGFMPFYPGPGVGGHCIPVDPLYLTWIAKRFNCHMGLIELSDKINSFMPYYTVSKIDDALDKKGETIENATILILGVTYKRDMNDARESPALRIMELLQRKGAKIHYNDPHINQIESDGKLMKSVNLSETLLHESDCVVIATDHSCYDYEWISRNSRILIDPRYAC
jgi:UDP-N-acetyl-D-glucosamine dehydrogenase